MTGKLLTGKRKRTMTAFAPIAASPSLLLLLLLLVFLFLSPPVARGHGYLATPRSRNVHAQLNTNWAGDWKETDPMPENCMQCLAGVTAGGCGIAGQNNYDVPKNVFGGILPATIQEKYAHGEEIVVDVVLTAHHRGHFVFGGCPIDHGQAPTQPCFDAHRLTFVEDLLHGANFDENYPERAYVAPPVRNERRLGQRNHTLERDGIYSERGRVDVPSKQEDTNQYYSFKMRLPSGLSGDLVLIQWHYVTGNNCIHDGYLEYDWPYDWEYDLDYMKRMDKCGSYSGVEQFWNCAEVKITGGRNVNQSSSANIFADGYNGSSNNNNGNANKTNQSSSANIFADGYNGSSNNNNGNANKPSKNKKPGKKKKPGRKKKPGKKKKPNKGKRPGMKGPRKPGKRK